MNLDAKGDRYGLQPLRDVVWNQRRTMKSVAVEMGIPSKTVQSWAVGYRKPPIARVQQLVEVLGVSACELFTWWPAAMNFGPGGES